jgi:hypothetical protein
VAIKNNVTIFASSNRSALPGQEQTGASGAQTANKAQTQLARRRVCRRAPFANREGYGRLHRASNFIFLTNHCEFNPLNQLNVHRY